MSVLLLALSLIASAADDIPAARVTLPWNDFRVLYEKGQAPKEKPEVAPRDFALARAAYTGVVEGESTVFTARVRVEVLKDKGWVAIPLLPTSVALRGARVNKVEAPIYLDGGWYTFVTNQKGPIEIELDFAVSTWESAGQSGFAFGLAPSGATELKLTVPADKALDFQVANAQRVVKSEAAGKRVIDALLPATGNLSVTWQRAVEEATTVAATAKLYAEHKALIGVGEGLLRGTSTIDYSILHAGVDHLRLSIPSDLTLLDVTGRGVGDWKVTEGGPRKVVDVDLTFEAKGSFSLRLDYEKPLQDKGGTIEVPDVGVLGVERVKGWVGLDARSNLELAPGALTGLRPVDVRELPAAILGQTDFPVLFGFTYRADGWKLPLTVRQYPEVDMLVTLVDQAEATTVLTPDGRRLTQVTYAMRNNSAQYLRVELPKGAELWSSFVGGRAVKAARAEDGKVLVPLARSQTAGADLARFAVELVYVETGAPLDEKGRGSLSSQLPQVGVPATAVAWTVYLPDASTLKRKGARGSMRAVDRFTPVDVGGMSSEAAQAAVRQQANAVFDAAAKAGGVEPVRVTLPLNGHPVFFEKLLVLNEPLTIELDLK